MSLSVSKSRSNSFIPLHQRLSMILPDKSLKKGESQPSVSVPNWESKLVGVIDVMDGKAVHAIAGQRAKYQPVSFCRGDVLRLAGYYAEIGLRHLYIADLNALRGKEIQWAWIEQLAKLTFASMMVDIGWCRIRLDALVRLKQFVQHFPNLNWIIATESCEDFGCFDAMLDSTAPNHIVLSLDFANGAFLNQTQAWDDWVKHALSQSVDKVIVLDVAAVGTASGGSTHALVRLVKNNWPSLQLYSGGGVRNELDVTTLLEAGCDGVLVATSLYPQS